MYKVCPVARCEAVFAAGEIPDEGAVPIRDRAGFARLAAPNLVQGPTGRPLCRIRTGS